MASLSLYGKLIVFVTLRRIHMRIVVRISWRETCPRHNRPIVEVTQDIIHRRSTRVPSSFLWTVDLKSVIVTIQERRRNFARRR